ncbi:unnamed protein product [Prunus armeniaca]
MLKKELSASTDIRMLGQEGLDDPLEGWKFGKGLHESPLGLLLEALLYVHQVLDKSLRPFLKSVV